jgi:hypothetical protein
MESAIAMTMTFFGFPSQMSLLPGLRKNCLVVFEKNSAKSKKILHFIKVAFLDTQ